MNENDVISGRLGKAFAIIGDNVEDLFYLKSLEATIEKNKVDVPILGKTGVGHKANGWSGSGTMTVYYTTSVFRQLMVEYAKTGRDLYFTIQIENEDPTSRIGRQTVLLKNVNLDSVIIAKIDVEADNLDEEVSFTFSDIDMLENFTSLQ
jgi:hypothetical protein